MNNVYKKSIAQDINFTNIKDNRFKTAKLSFNILMPLKAETVSANAILPFILRRSCKKYKNFTELNQKLANLYGASLYANVRKLGEVQVLSLSALFLDDRYALDKGGVSSEITDLLCEMIFNPNIEDGHFNDVDIAQEKRQLIENIESEYNDKRSYARTRCEELMCSDEAYGINVLGTKEQAKELTSDDIYEAWKRALSNAAIEIMLIGDADGEKVYEKFKSRFEDVKRGEIMQCSTSVIKSADTVKTYSESVDVAQAKLVMGFRTGNDKSDEQVDSTRLMCALFGETPQSKLFLNVREKLSLCYYCSSSFFKDKCVMYVQSGVDEKNIDKAKTEILKQLDSIREGDFDDDQLNSIKLSLSNALTSLSDYLTGLESWYLLQVLDKTIKSPKEKVESINSISRQQVIEAAKRVTLDTIYSLVGGRTDQND